jgi:hypothetical protein
MYFQKIQTKQDLQNTRWEEGKYSEEEGRYNLISLRKKENICWILLKFLGFVDGLLGAEEVLRGRR